MGSVKVGNCVHYNGLSVNATCRAGVDYRELVGGEHPAGWTLRLPCFTPYRKHPTSPVERVCCEKFQAVTEADFEADRERRNRRYNAWRALLQAHVCPTCRETVEFVQDGPCVFGSCGHRLFQGKVKK